MATWESNGHVTDESRVTLKCQGLDPNALRGQYLENDWRFRLCSKGSLIGNVMAYVELNGHVLDDVTCPVFLFVTQCVFRATFRIDKITWKCRKTANIIEKNSTLTF